jgi:hypothetical protein
MTSLQEALHKLPDPRRQQGRRYAVALVLCLLILAKLAGQPGLSATTDAQIGEEGSKLRETWDKAYERLAHRQIITSTQPRKI